MAMKRQPQPDQSKDHDGSLKSWTSGPIQCRLGSAADYEEILVFVAQLEEKLVSLN